MPKKGSLWESLGNVRHIQWIVVVLLLGVVLLVFAGGLMPKEQEVPAFADATPAPTPAADGLEERLEAVLSLVKGAGRVRVLVNSRQIAPAGIGEAAQEEITGVIVVADGAQDLMVRLELSRAVQSLLDVPQSNIEVLTMTDEEREE